VRLARSRPADRKRSCAQDAVPSGATARDQLVALYQVFHGRRVGAVRIRRTVPHPVKRLKELISRSPKRNPPPPLPDAEEVAKDASVQERAVWSLPCEARSLTAGEIPTPVRQDDNTGIIGSCSTRPAATTSATTRSWSPPLMPVRAPIALMRRHDVGLRLPSRTLSPMPAGQAWASPQPSGQRAGRS
jgi:hypothetical protein